MKRGAYVIGFFHCALCRKGIALCKAKRGYSLELPSIAVKRKEEPSP